MIEVLLGSAFMAVATRVSERWTDQLAEEVDETGRTLARRWWRELRDDNADQAKAAAGQLEKHVRANPQVLERLAAPPLGPPPAAAPSAAGEAPQPRRSRIEQFEEFLAYELGLVEGLRRPVALPGFFNCTDCVTVIDARRDDRPSGHWSVHLPKLDRGPLAITELEEQTLWLSFDYGDHMRPRVWLIPTASAARRDELIPALEERFVVTPPPMVADLNLFYLDSHDLRSLLADDERVQRVKGISHDLVTVVEEDRAGTDAGFYAIRSPDGLRLLRDALAARVMDQARRDGLFGDFFGS